MGLAAHSQTASFSAQAADPTWAQELLNKPQALFALALSPTRELAIQISEQFEALGAFIGVKCAVLVGGIDMMAQVLQAIATNCPFAIIPDLLYLASRAEYPVSRHPTRSLLRHLGRGFMPRLFVSDHCRLLRLGSDHTSS